MREGQRVRKGGGRLTVGEGGAEGEEGRRKTDGR